MTQPNLFYVPPEPLPRPLSAPYAPGSETSQAAAKSLGWDRVTKQARDLEQLYKLHGPLTDAEAATLLSQQYGRTVERSSVIPRRHALGGRIRKYEARTNPASGLLNDTYGLK